MPNKINYTPHDWVHGEIIKEEYLDNIEQGLVGIVQYLENENSLENYATKTYVDNAIGNIELISGEKGDKGDQGISIRFKGEWSSTVAYVNDSSYIDLVSYNGNTYICKVSNTNKSVSDTTYWNLVAKKGDQGEQGIQGEKGEQGEQGIQGLKGDKGETGSTWKPTVSSTGDLSWTLDNDTTTPTTVNIKGVKGDKGDKGDTGSQGIQGEKGDKGDKGDQGIQGLKGDKGEQGLKGEQGIQGLKGDKGDKGDDGLTTSIEVNGQVYNHSNGRITLPNLATESFVTSKIAEAQLSGEKVDLSGYATKEELNQKANIEHNHDTKYASKTNEHTHSNKAILDDITQTKIEEWNNKSNFDGDYNNLTNKPTIPNKTSQLTNDSNFVTKSYVDGEISKIENGGVDTSQFINREELEDYTGGKKQRYVTQSVYDALSTEEKNDINIIWNITDAQYPIPTFSIGTVTKLPANSEPIVTISGNEMNIVLNFGIPVGALAGGGEETEVFGNIVMNTSVSVVKTQTATISVKLDKAPTNNQIVNLGTTNNNVTLNKTSLTFTSSNYNTAQTVVVTGVNVGTCNINATSNNVAVKTCNVSITEEVYGNIITDINRITLKEGGNTSLQVKLDKQPTNSQIVTLSTNSTNITINPTTLTFTNANATNYQTITINAIEDNNEVEDEYTITISSPHATNKVVEIVVSDLAEEFVPSPDEPSVYDGEDFIEDLTPYTNDTYVTSPIPRAKKVSIHELYPVEIKVKSTNPVEKEGEIGLGMTGIPDVLKYHWCKTNNEGNIIDTTVDGYLHTVPKGSIQEKLSCNLIPIKTGRTTFTTFLKEDVATEPSHRKAFEGGDFDIAIVEAGGCGVKIEGADLTRYTPCRGFELETSASNHMAKYSVSLRRRPSNSATVTLTLNNDVATMQYNGENKNTVTFTFNRNNWFVPQNIVLIGNSVGNCSLEAKSEGNNVVADGNIEILTIPITVTEPRQSYVFKQNGTRVDVIEGEIGQTYTLSIGSNIQPKYDDADVFLNVDYSVAEFMNHTNNTIMNSNGGSYAIISLPKSDYTRDFKIKIKSKPENGAIYVVGQPYSENAVNEGFGTPPILTINVK